MGRLNYTELNKAIKKVKEEIYLYIYAKAPAKPLTRVYNSTVIVL